MAEVAEQFTEHHFLEELGVKDCSKMPKGETSERPIEKTRLYKLIKYASRTSLKEAWMLAWKQDKNCIQRRSDEDQSTYIHVLVDRAPDVYYRYGNLTHMIPLLYRLVMKGADINAQNFHGNTALHLALIRPNAEELCQHLIRLGADPCIQNNKEARIIYTYRNHHCELVKGQASSASGLWNAVQTENMGMVTKMLKSWCRVKIKQRYTLKQIAEETSNSRMVQLLKRYKLRNELICYALSCDSDTLHRIIGSLKDPVDLSHMDEAFDPPKPLIVTLEELGDWSLATLQMLRKHNVIHPYDYQAQIEEVRTRFEKSEFYELIETPTLEGLKKAAEIVSKGEVNLESRCRAEGREGWTYLHLIVDKYLMFKDSDALLSLLLIRILYRLGMADIDMNAKDDKQETALIKAAAAQDQTLITHLIRLGANALLTDREGRAPSETVYEDRGKFVFTNKYRLVDLPGLWAAVELDDKAKAERWLRTWARVKTLKGDRRLIDIARALNKTAIVHLMENYGLMNEFVCETFACNKERMMHIVAMGSGAKKVNTINDFYHAGYTLDRHAEYIKRPLIISALEICSADVIIFLIEFGADLTVQYEESFPCGPAAFWSFRDHISNESCLVVASFADVTLRDELGCTMLHRVIKKEMVEGKVEIVAELLERGIDVAARNCEGLTARDYILLYDIEKGEEILQMIDDHVMHFVINDKLTELENLLLNAYDHITDIKDSKRHKTCEEVAVIRQYSHIVKFLKEHDQYQDDIFDLQNAVKSGDMRNFYRLFGEKKCALARDKGGRTLLHLAIMYEQTHMVRILLEQYPMLASMQDNLNRTPLHYCMCSQNRKQITAYLDEYGADHSIIDTNNMTPAQYLNEIRKPTPIQKRQRGRRTRNFTPGDPVWDERKMDYDEQSRALISYVGLLKEIKNEATVDFSYRKIIDARDAELPKYNLDIQLLTKCIELNKENLAINLILSTRCRPHVTTTKTDEEGKTITVTLEELAREANMEKLADFIHQIPKVKDKEKDKDKDKDGDASETEAAEGKEDGSPPAKSQPSSRLRDICKLPTRSVSQMTLIEGSKISELSNSKTNQSEKSSDKTKSSEQVQSAADLASESQSQSITSQKSDERRSSLKSSRSSNKSQTNEGEKKSIKFKAADDELEKKSSNAESSQHNANEESITTIRSDAGHSTSQNESKTESIKKNGSEGGNSTSQHDAKEEGIIKNGSEGGHSSHSSVEVAKENAPEKH